jgi:hypothetical protein
MAGSAYTGQAGPYDYIGMICIHLMIVLKLVWIV